MVHLANVPAKPEGSGSQKQLSTDDDVFTTSVYGSRFAGQDMPEHEMPESQMPKEIAYRMIQDHLSLDNNPKLK